MYAIKNWGKLIEEDVRSPKLRRSKMGLSLEGIAK